MGAGGLFFGGGGLILKSHVVLLLPNLFIELVTSLLSLKKSGHRSLLFNESSTRIKPHILYS
jgi:hypothetical protein